MAGIGTEREIGKSKRGFGKGDSASEATKEVEANEGVADTIGTESEEELLKSRDELLRGLHEVTEAIERLQAEAAKLEQNEGAIIAEMYQDIGVGEELQYHTDVMTPPRQNFASRGVECIKFVIETDQAIPLFKRMSDRALSNLNAEKEAIEKRLGEIESKLEDLG